VSITVKAPLNLQALLATMKSAKKQRVGMAIWDRDIKAVEDAIATIEDIRAWLAIISLNASHKGKP
jgi:hypothetical protein